MLVSRATPLIMKKRCVVCGTRGVARETNVTVQSAEEVAHDFRGMLI